MVQAYPDRLALAPGFRPEPTWARNAHRTVLREILYRHHPWFGRRVCVHGSVDKGDGVVFRCTLDRSQADRWLEVPAWMFDRTACPDAELLTAQPFVSIDALAALSAEAQAALTSLMTQLILGHAATTATPRTKEVGDDL